MGERGSRVDRSIPVDRKGKVSFSNLNPVQKKAYYAWTNQQQRCTNPKRPDYQYYGGLGIQVEYTREDFIVWYQKAMDEYGGVEPTIGRIDHSKNYCFENIRIDSFNENRSERWYRRGRPDGNKAKKVGLFSKKTHECIATFPSTNICERELGLGGGFVSRNARDSNINRSDRHSWYYRFV